MSDLNRVKRASAKRARLGQQAACGRCGEMDIRTVQSANVVLCAECRQMLQGKAPVEKHHPAGQHNDSAKFPLTSNDHAILSDAQIDWPTETLRNPHRDPLRRLAAWLRFFVDTFRYLADQANVWAAQLETASDMLASAYGASWFAKSTGA